jgi:aspartyl-tRNA(Asn)/glutamyl-tRNA(Gln) amidotransferase subunit B
VDFNRSCVPLLEIVSEPDLQSPAEAITYWRAVKEILEHVEISDCNMEEGSFRCDANISLRPLGNKEFGTRTELKNKNSFQHVLAALEYEEKRQARILDEGGEVNQVTLLFDLNTGRTSPMRSKEEAHDYRYFPEPDLVPFEVDQAKVDHIRSTLPELPADRRKRFEAEYDLPAYDAGFLTTTRQIADFFDETARLSGDPKASSNWIMGDFSALLNNTGIEIQDSKMTPAHLSELIKLIQAGTISGKIAKSVIVDMFETGKTASQVVKEKGLSQITDTSEIEAVVDQVIAENPGPAQDYRDGKKKAIGFLVGQVMKVTRGKANPQMVNQLLRQKLEG